MSKKSINFLKKLYKKKSAQQSIVPPKSTAPSNSDSTPSINENVTIPVLSAFQLEELDINKINLLCGSVEQLLVLLNTSIDYGIFNRSQARIQFGTNKLKEKPPISLLLIIFQAFKDRTLIILSIAAFTSIIIGCYEYFTGIDKMAWIEGVAILMAVVIVVLINSLNDWQREQRFRELFELNSDRLVIVIEHGIKKIISVFDVVVGDVVVIQPGDILPADGIIVKNQDLKIDESSSTGESQSVLKREHDTVLAETKVLDGTGLMLCTAVGPHSFHGKMMNAMDNEGEAQFTPLQIKLDHLAEQIAKLGATAAILMLIALLCKLVIECIYKSSVNVKWLIQRILGILIQTITIIVVAVPEGLPMAVTIALAYATTKMLEDNNLVRVLSACETMGTATTICTDKTGTLTENQMTVIEGEIFGKCISELQKDSELLHQIICVNSTVFKDENGSFIGSSTEAALLRFLNIEFEGIRKLYTPIKVYPFSSEHKSMTTIIKVDEDCYRVLVKGAAEIVLEQCVYDLDVLTDINQVYYQELIKRMARKSLRTIAFAYKDYDKKAFESLDLTHAPLKELVLIGIVGIADSLRNGVIEAVKSCQTAGIFIRMVTGDNKATAEAIAREAGILQPGGIVIEGARLRRLDENALEEIIPRLQVVARSSPLDKQILVKKLCSMGEIVAVTGDGTNDGPALRAANVGFSMGIVGTEVAKAASSIILLDDNFASIVRAVAWGRCVNASVRKFLQFQLTVNVSAVVISFVSSLYDVHGTSILSAVQLLWINLIMDSLGALALATEAPNPGLLKQYPDAPTLGLITRPMWRMIIIQATFQILVMGIIVVVLPELFWPDLNVSTMAFNTFVLMQLFNEVNCRLITSASDKELYLNPFKGLFHASMFVIIWVGCVLIQVVIINYGGLAFGIQRSLTVIEWAASVSISLLTIPLGILVRILPISSRAEETIVYQSRERLRWQSAVEQVRTRMAVYGAIHRRISGRLPIDAKA